MQLLFQLRRQINEHGFNSELDRPILEIIYGGRGGNYLREDLYDSYEIWLQTSRVSEEDRLREGCASPVHCRMKTLSVIDKEIIRLSRDQQARASVRTARTQLEVACRNVPDGPGLPRDDQC